MVFNSQEITLRPRLLIAYADPAYASRIARAFRRLGWEVHRAASAGEVERLVDVQAPDVVFIEVGLPDASGWSASARIAAHHPGQRIVLLGDDAVEKLGERLHAAGASALIRRADGMEGLVRAAYGHALAKAV